MNEPDMEITFRDDSRHTVRYVSGTTVREEALDLTRLIGLYWSASGQVQRENITDSLPGMDPLEIRLQVFDLIIDGQELHNLWDWVSTSERDGGRPGTSEGVVELRHRVRPVTIKVVTRLDGTPFMVRYLEITNTGDSPAAVSNVSPWSGILWASEQHVGLLDAGSPSPFTLGWFDAIAPGTEGNLVWESLPRGIRRIESTNGQSGFGGPYFIVRNEATGESAIGALAWSGSWYAEFWHDPRTDIEDRPVCGLNLGFKMGPLGPAPLRVMAPGETVRTPETHLAILHASFDSCVQAMHDHLRTSVIPPRPSGKEMFTIAGRVVEEPGEWILREIDIAAEMGAEAYMVDAGWYGDEFGSWWSRRGDWNEGDWIPGGLAACAERARSHNMLFGLWMEPECAGPESRLLREHPDWMLETDGGARTHHVLNLANPDAARYVTDSMLRVIRDYKLDFFKTDYNLHVYEGGQEIHDGYAEHEAWRHYEVMYSIYDRIRSEMPHVALENCASGGGRNDLGMLSRMHYGCESDYSTFPQSIRAINGLTVFIPPESLCYYHNHFHFAHQTADLDTHLRVTLFAQPIFVGFGAQDADRTTEYFDKVRRYIRLAKETIRLILAGHPRVFHHTPDIGVRSPADWCVLEYAARDGLSSYAGIFRLGKAVSDEYCFRPRGLDESRAYKVTLDNSGRTIERDGADLICHGIPVRLDGLYSSELLIFHAK